MFFRVTRAGRYQYVQIARSYRDGSETKQQTLLSLGRLDALQASGQLDALLRSGLRLSKQLVVLDAHAAGQTEAVRLRKIGPDLVFGRLWEETGIAQALAEQLQDRRYEFAVERAIYLTVLHRLFVSGSDRAAEQWREGYRIEGVEGLELHQIYRAMAFLGGSLTIPHFGILLALGREGPFEDTVDGPEGRSWGKMMGTVGSAPVPFRA